MFGPASLVIRPVHVGCVLGCSCRCRQPGSLPIGTYITKISVSHQEFDIDALHPIRFIREDVDDQLLVLRFPPSAC